ncbi:ABC transporter permease [Pseudorhodoferax sp. Leaf265]|jgi:putative spermidine/putrescine transport system permease protein|uniref:ABC transporter permease n=1 Tax=Pseudorhodoferax sp. Leaf265 TaxID=1736315 RepID=UPI000AD189D6|nr:ABC transporter permease [Pseudorhodoferax sp. Leaf265]PZQ01965.1 MAG: ABC transporter permease [Variovorax paradoxus]PZQ15213.1 MAG: ABC transporter permease [Variovorax paradoxus]
MPDAFVSGALARPATAPRAAESLAGALERRSFWAVFGVLGVCAGVLLLAPTVVVLITSFTSGFSLKFPPPGYSVRWYQALWESPELIDAGVLSLKLAAVATSISVVLAVAAALALARRREGWARAAEAVLLSPLMLPALAIGLSLLMLFNIAGTGLSFWTLVLGHVAITTPYILRTTSASLLQMDGVLLESAHSLGASPLYVFRTITLPLIARGVLAGAFIGFMYSFDNVAVSLFLSDARSEVLPIRMWHIIESNLDVRAAAVSGVLIAATLVLMIVMERVAGITRHMR